MIQFRSQQKCVSLWSEVQNKNFRIELESSKYGEPDFINGTTEAISAAWDLSWIVGVSIASIFLSHVHNALFAITVSYPFLSSLVPSHRCVKW